MENKINFKIPGMNFTKENFVDLQGDMEIFIINQYIGHMRVMADDGETNSIYLEYFEIEEEYRNKGYGTIAMINLKDIGKQWGFKYIEGECRSDLIHFYKNIGASFHSNHEYINHKFYINL